MASENAPWSEPVRVLAGDRLRRTRNQQRLSIRQLAELAGVSKTSVVQVESGRSSRRGTYLKVAEALGLHLDRLSQPEAPEERPYAVHGTADDAWFDLANFGAGPLADDAQTDPEARRRIAAVSGATPLNILASRLERGRIKPTILELYGPSAVRSHAGEEHVHVLCGRAVVTVGGSDIPLEAGESITFWSSEPHAYAPRPGSPLPVRLLSVRVDA